MADDGPISVAVRGTLLSNSIGTIRTTVLAGVGIGLFARVSLADELGHRDIVTVLYGFVKVMRDISLVWSKRRFVPVRGHRATDFLAKAL